MRTHPRTGFTLVETMVAIAVFAVALVGPYLAVNNSLNASYIARDELTASALAQEGMEYVRSIRDNNYLNSRTWMNGFTTLSCYGGSPTGYCSVDPTQGDLHTSGNAVTAYSSFANVPYLYVSSGNLYNQQSSGTQTRFKRGVQIQSISATEVLVTVTVSWSTAHQSYSVTVTDTLQDWI